MKVFWYAEAAFRPPYGLEEAAPLLPSPRDHRRHLPPVAMDTAQPRCDRKDCGMGLGVVKLWFNV